MRFLRHLFLSHPQSLGESYGEHAATAARFGWTMVVGGAACLVHALVPAWFSHTASDRVKALYAQMKARQPAFSATPPAFKDPAWQLEYEI